MLLSKISRVPKEPSPKNQRVPKTGRRACQYKVEVRYFPRAGYFILVHHGLRVWPVGRAVGTSPSPSRPSMPSARTQYLVPGPSTQCQDTVIRFPVFPGDQEILVFHLQEVLVDQTSVLDLHQVVLEVVPEVLVLEVLEVVAARFNKCYIKF